MCLRQKKKKEEEERKKKEKELEEKKKKEEAAKKKEQATESRLKSPKESKQPEDNKGGTRPMMNKDPFSSIWNTDDPFAPNAFSGNRDNRAKDLTGARKVKSQEEKNLYSTNAAVNDSYLDLFNNSFNNLANKSLKPASDKSATASKSKSKKDGKKKAPKPEENKALVEELAQRAGGSTSIRTASVPGRGRRAPARCGRRGTGPSGRGRGCRRR